MNISLHSRKTVSLLLSGLLLMLYSGCETTSPKSRNSASSGAAPTQAPTNDVAEAGIILREGDALKISFPSSPKLDSAQQIRRDGKVVLPVLGELKAAGFTPADLEKEILRLYGSQLVSKEVTVTLESSVFPVFVNGAVLHGGKITSNRPITALEAIMEAGGFDYAKANLKAVKVIRNEGNQVRTFVLDFRGVLDGKPSEAFYVKPSDIIFVPERFTLF